MGLLELCEEVFGTADLYRVLGVRREASDGEVRRGYHKVSLQVHPDRVGEGDKEDATRRFQVRTSLLHRPPGLLRVSWPIGPARVELSEPGLARFLIFIFRFAVSVRGRGDFWMLFPQILGKVYSVLSDKEQRAVYDEQGTVDEDSDVLNQDRDWETYWRLLFKKVEDSGGLDFSLFINKCVSNASNTLHFVLFRDEQFLFGLAM